MKSILVVEDDPDIVELLKINLQDLNQQVFAVSNGLEAMQLIEKHPYDLILLDLNLPGLDGLEICKRTRVINKTVPILILTAKSEEFDTVLGLELGADDYVVKPFSIRELKARIKALYRRAEVIKEKEETNNDLILAGEMQIDIPKRKVLINEKKIELSRREFDLLLLLASNPGISFSRSRLLNQVWGYDFEGFEHTVNTHINRLRSKIEHNMAKPTYILTTWGVGYRFNEELN